MFEGPRDEGLKRLCVQILVASYASDGVAMDPLNSPYTLELTCKRALKRLYIQASVALYVDNDAVIALLNSLRALWLT